MSGVVFSLAVCSLMNEDRMDFMERLNSSMLLVMACGGLLVMNGCHASGEGTASANGAAEKVENQSVVEVSNAPTETNGNEVNGSGLSTAEVVHGVRKRIVIDGRFDDWEGVDAIAWEGVSGDESGDESGGGASSSIDLDAEMGDGGTPVLEMGDDGSGTVSVAYDDDWVYLRVGLGGVHNAQGLDGSLSLEFDVDGNALTGVVEAGGDGESTGLAGVDFELVFSPVNVKTGKTGGAGAFALEQGIGRTVVNPYDVGVSFLPTYADHEIEVRLRRGVEIPGTNVDAFVNNTFSFQCVRTTANGSITEHTIPAMVMMDDEESESSAAVDSSGGKWMRKPMGAVRIMSWNIEVGHLFDEPDSFARVINAVQPDVICFQEMGRHRTGAELRRWLEKEVPVGEGWDVQMRIDGDVAIATKLASVRTGPSEMPAIAGGKYPVRAAMLLIGYGGKRVVVSSVHLKCCGRAGDRSDLKRIAETGVIHDILSQSVVEDHAIGMLVMGDFNLVGSRTPLDNLVKGADLDGSDLLDIAPLRLHDSTSTTWRDRGQPYLPGRLDFALVSDSTVQVVESFVFDSALLSDSELKASGVLRGDCGEASDHLPIVVDLKW